MPGSIQAAKDRVAISNQSGLPYQRWDQLDTVLINEFHRPIDETTLEPSVIAQLKSKGIRSAGEGAIHRLLNAPDLRIVAKMQSLIFGRAPKTVIHRTETPDLSEVPTSELLEQLNLTAVEQAEVVDETPNPSKNNDIDG
jgi:hypothetical protein